MSHATDIITSSANNTAIPDEREHLAAAFDLFNQMSSALSDTYQVMESRVGLLQKELLQATRQREEGLRQKEALAQRLESLLNLLPAGVIVIDPTGRVSETNPAVRELLGEDLLGRLWRDVIAEKFIFRPEDGHEVSLHDGRLLSIATRSLPDGQGQLLLLNDLTETRRLQERVNRHNRLMDMGRMLSSLAHQIRTPLSAALLYASHLADDDQLTSQQVQRFAGKVRDRLLHLERQVRDMLIFVKGDVRLTDYMDVEELLEAVNQSLEVPLASHQATLSIDNQSPHTQFLGNRDSLVGAIMNVMNNAIQAVGQGAQLFLRCYSENNQLILQLRDNGPGLDAVALKGIQEPFFTTKPQGTGLGLQVVRAVVEAHHGQFELSNHPEGGALVRISLPVATKDTLRFSA